VQALYFVVKGCCYFYRVPLMAWLLDLSWIKQGHNSRSRQHLESIHYCSVGNMRQQGMVVPVLVAAAMQAM
jgi:hypothetical protein